MPAAHLDPPSPMILTKHHALGNDFLILLDTDDRYADIESRAVDLCARRTGVGADGLIRLGPELRMHLHNADGSRAEMSGNGIRCLAQAMLGAGIGSEAGFEIITDAGPRRVTPGETGSGGSRQFTADMGLVKVTDLEDRRAEVDIGNPHLVLLVADPEAEELVALGAENPALNVEVVRVDDRSTVTMRVHERGAGITSACGTGSCAIAAATRAWGLTGEQVSVRNPGGELVVELNDDQARLTGSVQFVARIEVDLSSWP